MVGVKPMRKGRMWRKPLEEYCMTYHGNEPGVVLVPFKKNNWQNGLNAVEGGLMGVN